MKKVGLVIVNFNDSGNAINLIKSVEKYKVINKIVVVDNKSTDNSYALLSELKSRKVHIIESECNKGYSYAINLGAKYLEETLKDCYIIISNTDIVIDSEEHIKKLLESFSNQNVAVVMPKVYENGVPKYGWKLTSPNIDLLMNIPLVSRLYKDNLKNYDPLYINYNDVVDVIYGCFFAIDGSVLKSIGYMDEYTFLYYEEYILARKLKAVNKISVVNKEAEVTHKHNVSIGNSVTNLNKYKIYKNSQLYYEQYYNNANELQIILFELFYYIGLLGLKVKNFINQLVK